MSRGIVRAVADPCTAQHSAWAQGECAHDHPISDAFYSDKGQGSIPMIVVGTLRCSGCYNQPRSPFRLQSLPTETGAVREAPRKRAAVAWSSMRGGAEEIIPLEIREGRHVGRSAPERWGLAMVTSAGEAGSGKRWSAGEYLDVVLCLPCSNVSLSGSGPKARQWVRLTRGVGLLPADGPIDARAGRLGRVGKSALC